VKDELVLEKYTRALFEVADERKALKEVEIEWKQKLDLAETLSRGLSPYIVNFIKLLMEKERQSILPGVPSAFKKMLELKAKRKQAIVTTVVPLPAFEKELLEKKLRELIKEDIILENRVEPEILGGLKVQIGHTMVDGTLSRKLEELGKRLARG
jgi:F-type H+-transporting ATPase subunit delta